MLALPVLFVYVVLFIYEFVPLYRQEKWREFWVNAVLGALSLTAAIMLCLDIKITSPEKPIREFILWLIGK